MANTPPPVSQRKSKNWLIIPIVAVILIALIVGFWIGNHSVSPSNQQPSGTSENQLTIASFNTTYSSDVNSQMQAYLDLEVSHYWVEGNKVFCNGTVRWQTTEYTLDGMNLALIIYRTDTPYIIDVELFVYGGIMFTTGQNVIDSSAVSVPKLGDQIFSYDFSLNCTYH